jgi:hypothetical protein
MEVYGRKDALLIVISNNGWHDAKSHDWLDYEKNNHEWYSVTVKIRKQRIFIF